LPRRKRIRHGDRDPPPSPAGPSPEDAESGCLRGSPVSAGDSRFGTIVPKHRRTIVERNRLRRRLREIGRRDVLPALRACGRKGDVSWFAPVPRPTMWTSPLSAGNCWALRRHCAPSRRPWPDPILPAGHLTLHAALLSVHAVVLLLCLHGGGALRFLPGVSGCSFGVSFDATPSEARAMTPSPWALDGAAHVGPEHPPELSPGPRDGAS
jgi:hypothetical protein